MSLHHPARDSRMMAVVILGNLGSVKALPEFESIIDDDAGDIYLLREVIKVLPKIKYPKSAELLEKACTHSSPLIRRLAEEQLKKIDIR